MSLPFELPKYHKLDMKRKWKNRGVIFVGLFEEIYDIYIHSSECDKCIEEYEEEITEQIESLREAQSRIQTFENNIRQARKSNGIYKNNIETLISYKETLV